MYKNKSPAPPGTIILLLTVIASALLFSFCASESGAVETSGGAPAETEAASPSRYFELVVPSPQKTVYSGKPQPLSFQYDGGEEPEIVYYQSAEARAEDRGGSAAAPIDAGVYYVRVKHPAQNDAGPREEIFADYRILKRPVKINARQSQEAFYNGDPKRVEAASEPPVPLSYSYYPNRELMETAVNAARKTFSGDAARPGGQTFRGYRRVDRAPIEQGTYYVWVYYPGDNNHGSAEAFVEFTILPPRQGIRPIR